MYGLMDDLELELELELCVYLLVGIVLCLNLFMFLHGVLLSLRFPATYYIRVLGTSLSCLLQAPYCSPINSRTEYTHLFPSLHYVSAFVGLRVVTGS